jgi:hypothetical protein
MGEIEDFARLLYGVCSCTCREVSVRGRGASLPDSPFSKL